MRGALAGLLMAALPGIAYAHEIIDQGLVAAVDERIAGLRSLRDGAEAGPARAEAACDLAELLLEVVDLINRSLAMHGDRPSAPTERLLAILAKRGLEPRRSQAGARLRVERESWRLCLALTDDRERAADARLQLLRAGFYESFTADPRELIELSHGELLDQVAAARAFLDEHPEHPHAEEAAFILAVNRYRAFHHAPDGHRAELAEAARGDLAAYLDQHAGVGLRTEAVRALLGEIEARGLRDD